MLSDARLDELIESEEANERMLNYMNQGSVAHVGSLDRLAALRHYKELRAGVVDGWKLVPREATKEQIDAMDILYESNKNAPWCSIYRVAIKAAKT